MKILYIEDEPNDANFVSLYLNTTEHHFKVVEDSNQARDAFRDQPDLILVDLMLGRMREGFTLVREFRAEGYTRPVIAVTALTTPQDLRECEEVGVDYVLQKPFIIKQLVDVLAKYKS